MRSFWPYTFLLLAALAVGAFLWGLVYAFWPLPVPHHKLVKYGALLVAIVVLVLWARRRVTRDALGLSGGIESLLVQGLVAFSLTVALLVPLWLFLIEMNARFLDPWMWSLELSYKLAGYLIAALAVATVEELYFRGLLLSRVSSYWLPLTASALFYAGIHFLNPTPDPGLADQWNGGWLLLANATLDMPEQWLKQLPHLSLLLLIGLGLGLVRLHTGSLAFCIGAHAAMVFSLKSFQFFTYPGPFGPAWLGTDASGGWTGVAWMAILVLGLWHLSPKLGKTPRN